MDYRDFKAKVIAFGSITLLIGCIVILLPLILNGSLPLYVGIIICGVACLFGFIGRTRIQTEIKSPTTSMLNIQFNKESIKAVDDAEIVQAELDNVTRDIHSYIFAHDFSNEKMEELESYRRYLVPKLAYLTFGLEHVKWVTPSDKRDWPEWAEYLRCEHGIIEPEIRKPSRYSESI